jgi:hypothetical protein
MSSKPKLKVIKRRAVSAKVRFSPTNASRAWADIPLAGD